MVDPEVSEYFSTRIKELHMEAASFVDLEMPEGGPNLDLALTVAAVLGHRLAVLELREVLAGNLDGKFILTIPSLNPVEMCRSASPLLSVTERRK